MDVFMVNLNQINAKEGDEVVVFDKRNNAENFAKSFYGRILILQM